MLRDRYVSLLRAEVVKCKLAIVQVRSQLESAKSDEELKEYSRTLKQFTKNRQLLIKRIAVMESPRELKERKYLQYILVWVGASALRTQRVSRLSPAEVCLRPVAGR